jgi:hypothetical protein
VFNSLAQRYLDDFIELVRGHLAPGRSDDWAEVLGELIAYVAGLYQREPTARVLFLGGALTPEIATAHHLENNARMAGLMREVVEATGQPELGSDPDPYLIVVETVIAVLATSQRCLGRIEPSYTGEARRLAIGYLRSHLDATPASPS